MLTDRIKACTLLEDLMIPDDGDIGIPVRACVLFDKDSFKIKHGHGGTPIVVGLEAIVKRGFILKLIFIILLAIVIIFQFFPGTWANFTTLF